jgi:hypothetical protein
MMGVNEGKLQAKGIENILVKIATETNHEKEMVIQV